MIITIFYFQGVTVRSCCVIHFCGQDASVARHTVHMSMDVLCNGTISFQDHQAWTWTSRVPWQYMEWLHLSTYYVQYSWIMISFSSLLILHDHWTPCGVLPLAGLDPGCHRSSAKKKNNYVHLQYWEFQVWIHIIPHINTQWVPSLRRYHAGRAPDFHIGAWCGLDAMGRA